MSTSAGRVLLLHKGDYDSSKTYSPMDEVLYQGSTYVCKQTSTGNAPTNTTYWQMMAQKGTDGSGGVPSGGLKGRVLAKASNTDYDVTWKQLEGIPSLGYSGQFLMKNSDSNWDVIWGSALSIDEARENELILGKNMFQMNPFIGTESNVSVTYSNPSTGEVTLNGNAGDPVWIGLSDPIANPDGSTDGSLSFKANISYVLSSPQWDDFDGNFYLAIKDKNGNTYAELNGPREEFSVQSDTSGLFLMAKVNYGVQLSNQKLQAMICTLADWNASPTYEPYHRTTSDRVQAIIDAATNAADFAAFKAAMATI